MATLTDLIQRVKIVLTDFNKFQGQIKGIGDTFERLGTRMRTVGRRMSLYLTAPIVGAFTGVIKLAGDFEAAMNRVEAVSGEAGSTLERLRDTAKELGITTQFSATQAAEAIEVLIKNGLNAEQVLNGAVEATLKLAAATGSDLSIAADNMTDIMVNFRKEGAELNQVVDNIAGTLTKSKLGFDQYVQAAGQAAGVAGPLGLSLEDMNAGLAATAQGFANGGEAGTSFKTFLLKLVPDGDKAAEMMERFNLKFFDAEGQLKSLGAIAETLRSQLGGLSTVEQIDVLKTLFGQRSVRTALSLMEQGADGIEKMRVEIAAISAQEQAEARLKGIVGEMVKLKSATEGLAIAVADTGLLETTTNLIKSLTELVRWLAEVSPGFLKFVVVTGLVVAALGPLIWSFGMIFSGIGAVTKGIIFLAPYLASLISTIRAVTMSMGALNIAMLVNPFSLLVVAVAALGAGIASLIYYFTQTEAGIQSLENIIDHFGTGVENIFESIRSGISNVIDNLRVRITNIGTYIKAWADSILAFINNIINTAKKLIGVIKDSGLGRAVGSVTGAFGFARGGSVYGPGTTTSDSIPAWLSKGEYVIKAAAVRKYGKWLFDLLNAGRFAKGGFITSSLRISEGRKIPSIDTNVGSSASAIQGALSELGEDMRSITTHTAIVPKNIEVLGKWLSVFSDAVKSNIFVVDKLAALAANKISGIGSWIAKLVNVVQELQRVLSSVKPTSKAIGGRVWGAGSSTSDSIMARLSRGEYVIKAAAVDYYGQQLFDLLNNMMLPKMASGGSFAGSVSGSGTSAYAILNLTLGNQTFSGLMAPKETADNLIRYSRSEQARKAGNKPGWYR